MPMHVTALDGNVLEVGAKVFLRSGVLVSITTLRVENDRAVISWRGFSGGRSGKDYVYNLEGEKHRIDYEIEDNYDILSVHSYKSNGFNKAIRLLEAKGQALRA